MYQKRYFIKIIIFLSLIYCIVFLRGALLQYNINSKDYYPVLDNSSKNDLPYIFLNIEQLKNTYIDSIVFKDSIEINRDVYIFEGNKPLSFDLKKNNKKSLFNKNIKPMYEKGYCGGLLKIYPYKKKDRLFIYKSFDIYYTLVLKSKWQNKNSSIYDYLIICPAQYDTAFERLKNWKIRAGYKTKLITVEYIDSISIGNDLQERIRNFIIDEYNNNNFKFLLLAGDSTMIPVKKLFFMECGAGYYIDEDSIPADIYYSSLDGDFNFDNDLTFGEIEDSCDLYQELYIGRMLYDSTKYGPTPIINRTINYEKTNEISHLNRGLFTGMVLWSDPYTPGRDILNPIINDIIPSNYHTKTFYESDGHYGDVEIIDSMSMGYGITVHAGHGSYKGIWVDSINAISTWEALSLTNNNKTGLFYSIGCWVGAFDRAVDLRNFSLCMQASPDGGNIEIITNSRYGWGAPGYPGWGVSDMIAYQFFKILFNSDNKQTGFLLDSLKRLLAPLSNTANLYRWHLYQMNLFGDPSVSIYTRTPDSIFVKRIIKDNIMEVFCYDKYGNPLNGLRVNISNDSIIDRDTTDINGYAKITLDTINYNYLTILGTNKITYIDSFYISTENNIYSINFDSLFLGIDNSIYIYNNTDTTITLNILNSVFDTNISVLADSFTELDYTPYILFDTMYVYSDTSNIDTFFLKINIPVISIDSFLFSDGVLNIIYKSDLFNKLQNDSFNIKIRGSINYLDSTFIINGDSIINFQSILNSYENEIYIMGIFTIKSNSMIIYCDTIYIANNNYLFFDDFTNNLYQWDYIDSMWIINSQGYFHCGNDTSYYPDMNSIAISDSFIVVPGSICSIDIYANFPSLEFDSSSPIFDVDGLFIKLLYENNDTIILDFISSGGALNEKSEIIFEGFKSFKMEVDTPIMSRLFLQFISDYKVEYKGVFIKSIKIYTPYVFYIPDTGLQDNSFEFIERLNYPITMNTIDYMISNMSENLQLNIYSIDGRKVFNYLIKNNGVFTLDLSNFSSGIYFIVFRSKTRIYKDKVIFIK